MSPSPAPYAAPSPEPASPALEALFARRLLLVSGKGGVGKTTVALALARLAAREGKSVLLAGIESRGELGRLLGRPELGPDPVEVRPRLEACDLNASAALREYLKLRIKVAPIANWIAGNALFARFFAAAPGLREFVLLGKAWYEARDRSRWFGGARHDLVVLDAPATGHAVSFLRAAHQVSDLLVGPLRGPASELREFLTDASKTALVLVATPEELALNEAAELARAAHDELRIGVGLVVLNDVFPTLLGGERLASLRGLARPGRGAGVGADDEVAAGAGESALLEAGLYRARREAEEARLLRRARRMLPRPQVQVRRVLAPEDEEDVLDAVMTALGGEAGGAPQPAPRTRGRRRGRRPPRAGGGA
ncbi:MAG: hypothetical protein HYZ53_21395 [Planctomycetes bacterium]|nr:hypothetical protein [Planctomycetota bacterium]